jgi:hypothetical protein
MPTNRVGSYKNSGIRIRGWFAAIVSVLIVVFQR